MTTIALFCLAVMIGALPDRPTTRLRLLGFAAIILAADIIWMLGGFLATL